MKSKIISLLSRTITFCKSYIELSIWLLVFTVGIRFFEAILLYRINHDFALSIVWNLTGLCYDITLFLRISICILIVFITTCFFNEKITRTVLRILLSLMLLLSLICILFFTTSGFLLDKVVFSYSFKDIIGIIQSSSKSPIWVYMIVAVLPILYFYLSGKRIKINRILLVISVILTLFSFFFFKEISLHTDNYHIKANKEHFFLKSIFKKHIPAFKENNEDIINAVQEFRSYFPEHQFVETEFPFLYQSKIKDVLFPFFNLKPEPPNLVFIIVEGLSYDFLNTDYQLMPFLDSLSPKSLTWEYCLSVSARTYGVFPALFGAAPLGEKGFMAQCPNNPEYQSLLRILHQNNYTNHFFYGGWTGFDNMGYFFNNNKTKYLKDDEWDQDLAEQKIGAFWGYDDHLTYLQAHRKLNRMKSSPRVDIYLSLSTHDPFEYPESLHFQNKVKNNLAQNKNLSEKQKQEILDRLNLYGSFAYSDWALRQLFEGYRKRNDFDNTVFIITGDHNVFVKQFGGFSNHHVPLIIYSPLLKSERKMKGMVSHRDITPTILSLLQNNYGIKVPDEVTWLNTALDTSLTFSARTFSPLQIIDHTVSGIVYNNYILHEGILEEFTDNGTRKINNPDVQKQMNRLLSLYQSLDLYILNNDALIRNFYAHKNKSAKTIINIEDTITPKSHFAKISNLKVLEAPEGHNTALYFDGSYEYPIEFLHYKIPKDIEEFSIEIEFEIYIKNVKADEKSMNVVMDLQGASYKSDYLTIDKQNRWYIYKNMITCKKELLEQLDEERLLKIYLWNNEALEGYIDDIKIKVKVI